MSSKGKRASILKKQQFTSENHDVNTIKTTSSSSAFRSNRKIEFNRKKSIKEFIAGEDTDTIWGNSYEVSTDGTPSSVLGEVSLGNSTCRSGLDEQNKENRTGNLTITKVEEDEQQRPSPNSTNGSWDLSVTIAEDEKRRINCESSSAVYSQSLNTTERLMVEPFVSPEPKLIPKQTSQSLLVCGAVQAMDISPLKGNLTESLKKSPRKMIYYNPKEKLLVEINDVPQSAADAYGAGSRVMFQTPTKIAMRGYTSEAPSQATLRGSSYNVSETWDSHPHAMMPQLKLRHSNVDAISNVSSDVDTTLAITNTVAKLLENGPNLTIPVSTTMELDDSTTTEVVPTNALARARPSFLPSQRYVDESQNVLQTPPKESSSRHACRADVFKDSSKLDVSSPPGNYLPPDEDMVVVVVEDDVPLPNDIKTTNDVSLPAMMEEAAIAITNANTSPQASGHTTTASHHALSIDFGISSLSMKMAPNSPETPSVNRPKILRPTLPRLMFDGTTDQSSSGQTPKPDSLSRGHQGKLKKSHLTTEQEPCEIRRTIQKPEDMETSMACEVRHDERTLPSVCSNRIQTTYLDHTVTHNAYSIDGMAPSENEVVAMENTVQQAMPYRPTVHEVMPIVEESAHGHSSTTRVSAKPPSGDSEHATHYDPAANRGQQSMMIDEKTPKKALRQKQSGSMRGTIHGVIPIDDTTGCTERDRPVTRQTYYAEETMKVDTDANVVRSADDTRQWSETARKTFYPDETLPVVDPMAVVQHVAVTRKEHDPLRKTIVCNESMALDVCTSDGGNDTESSVSCRFYSKNIDEFSIYAEGPRGTIDMRMVRPSSYSCMQTTTTCNILHDMAEEEGDGLVVVETSTRIASGTSSLEARRIGGLATDGKPCEGNEAKRRFTTHDAAKMDETDAVNHTMRMEKSQHDGFQETSRLSLTESLNSDEDRCLRSTMDLRQNSVESKRFTIHQAGEMDVVLADKSTVVVDQPNDMDGTKIDDRCTESVISDGEGISSTRTYTGVVPRSTTYGCANMDATACQERSQQTPTAHTNDENHPKARYTLDGIGNKEDNFSCFIPTQSLHQFHGRRLEDTVKPNRNEQASSNGCTVRSESRLTVHRTEGEECNRSDLGAEGAVQPADLTNYNSFMVNHEMSQRPEKHSRQQRLTTCYMDGMNEATELDSTRLSKAPEQVKQSRLSLYHAEAMDETVPAGTEHQQLVPDNDGRESEMQHERSHRSHSVGRPHDKSTHQPEEIVIESPAVAQEVQEKTIEKSVGTSRQSAETSSNRRSRLRSIVRLTTAIEDMEGFSLLADDDDEPQSEELKLIDGPRSQQAIVRQEAAIDDRMFVDAEQKQCGAVNHRPTICRAEAILEDTLPTSACQQQIMETQRKVVTQAHYQQEECNQRQGHYQQDSHAVEAGRLRKIGGAVSMEETTLPHAVRIERRRSAFEKSPPMLYSAQHPPSFAGHDVPMQAEDNDAFHRNPERTPFVANSRQTMHEPCRMETTLSVDARASSIRRNVPTECVADDTRAVEVVSNRQTIHSSSSAMVETPPYAGRWSSAVGKGGSAVMETAIVPLAKEPLEEEASRKSVTGTRAAIRKPRQTILIPLDMEVDGGQADDVPSPGVVNVDEPSMQDSRDVTEDCVLRCAPSTSEMFRKGYTALRGEIPGEGAEDGVSKIFREPSTDGLKRYTSAPIDDLAGRSYRALRSVPSTVAHELSDISMCNTTMRPELPQLGNITATMSFREITEPLPPPEPPLTVLLPPEPNNSVSVIRCRVDREQLKPKSEETASTEERSATQAIVEVASEDEFYDAEGDDDDGAVAASQLVSDPLSLTKSQHLTMKFVDVEQLERTGIHPVTSSSVLLVPSTSYKRAHARLLCSPATGSGQRLGDAIDPLHMTTVQQPQLPPVTSNERPQTPQGPVKKRPRTSCANEQTVEPRSASPYGFETKEMIAVKEEELISPPEQPIEIEEVIPEVKKEKEEPNQQQQHHIGPQLSRVGSQTSIFLDPSVFVIEEDDLLDDESNPPCCTTESSFATEDIPSEAASVSPVGAAADDAPKPSSDSTTDPLRHPISARRLRELSFYREFANLTIDNLDSCDGVMQEPEQHPVAVDCISLSDDDSRSPTEQKGTLDNAVVPGRVLENVFNFECPRAASGTEVLDSTIASVVMHEVREKHPPITKHACCGRTQAVECLCRTQRELERRRQACEVVWDQFCTWFEALTHRHPGPSPDDDSPRQVVQATGTEQRSIKTLEEQIEELNWRLVRTKLDQTTTTTLAGSQARGNAPDEADRRRQRFSPIEGQYPETPSVVFLYENLQSYLAECPLADTSPPVGAPFPATPSITQLIANKLSCGTDSRRWMLDCSEEDDDLLVLRHRVLRSVVVKVQLQHRAESDQGAGEVEEDRRLERIQVRECQQEYVHSPKLLLSHIEFMRLAKETTERTLRSTYRTVASLMGLWQHFDELLRRVFHYVNRLLTITRNNDALLCYDAEMERFFVKKYFKRTLDDGSEEANMLTVHFNWIGSVCGAGVSLKRPIGETLAKLLPSTATKDRVAGGSATKAGSPDEHTTGLMFLECLLWNVAKQFES